MKKQSVELIVHCGNDNLIANVARISMGVDADWLELPKEYSKLKRDGLLSYLATHRHTSPFRHNMIMVRGSVPMFIARQLGKHQVGMSWNEQSRRYVDTPAEFFDMTGTWRYEPDANIKQGSAELIPEDQQVIADDIYANVIDTCEGAYDALRAMKICPEQARVNYPQSMMVEFVWTGSLMAFAHVYALRIDSHAQKEAQEFAEAIDKIVRPLFPVSWEALIG